MRVGLHLKSTVAEMFLLSLFVKLVLMTPCAPGGVTAPPPPPSARFEAGGVGNGVDEDDEDDEVVLAAVVDDRPPIGFGEHQAARGKSVSRKIERCILFNFYVCESFALVMISPRFSPYIIECCFAIVFASCLGYPHTGD